MYSNEYLMERIPYKLPKDSDKNKYPLFVQVNDYSAYIKRGVTVMLPRYVVFAIEESIEQDQKKDDVINDFGDKYESIRSAYGA